MRFLYATAEVPIGTAYENEKKQQCFQTNIIKTTTTVHTHGCRVEHLPVVIRESEPKTTPPSKVHAKSDVCDANARERRLLIQAGTQNSPIGELDHVSPIAKAMLWCNGGRAKERDPHEKTNLFSGELHPQKTCIHFPQVGIKKGHDQNELQSRAQSKKAKIFVSAYCCAHWLVTRAARCHQTHTVEPSDGAALRAVPFARVWAHTTISRMRAQPPILV